MNETSEKPFCTIDIPTAQCAAFLEALHCAIPTAILSDLQGTTKEIFHRYFPGDANEIITQEITKDFRIQLTNVLRDAGITEYDAPWTKPKAPINIGGYGVSCSSRGVQVGCEHVTLDEMKLLVEKCKAAGTAQ